MREIKFRGWNGKKFIYYNNWFTLSGQYYLCFEEQSEHYYIDDSDVDFPQRITLQQYTGVKDKNGKEIYEGDIVKRDNDILDESINVVEYSNSTARFILWNNKNKLGYWFDNDETKCSYEVIGNIYENPELLK